MPQKVRNIITINLHQPYTKYGRTTSAKHSRAISLLILKANHVACHMTHRTCTVSIGLVPSSSQTNGTKVLAYMYFGELRRDSTSFKTRAPVRNMLIYCVPIQLPRSSKYLASDLSIGQATNSLPSPENVSSAWDA